jgi:cell division protein FtsW
MRMEAVDQRLVVLVMALLGIGVVMVFSASSVTAYVNFNTPYYFLIRQLIWAVLGGAAAWFFSRFDYHQFRRHTKALAILTAILLVAVLIPHVGRVIAGGRRWLGFGSLEFQPSELAKLALAIVFADTLTGGRFPPRDLKKGYLPHILVVAAVFYLVLKEPDLGTALCLGGTAFIMLYLAGARASALVGTLVLAIPALVYEVVAKAYRLQRLLAFLDPAKTSLGSGYHILQSLFALGSGGFLGVGLGRSAFKFFYLPEQYTDSIFAILGNELGFIGGAVVLVLFVLLLWRGFKIAAEAPDAFGRLLAAGLTSMIMLQALLNVAVVTDTVPVTGIPLPFISYGGSSLVFTLAGIGILLNISRQRKKPS